MVNYKIKKFKLSHIVSICLALFLILAQYKYLSSLNVGILLLGGLSVLSLLSIKILYLEPKLILFNCLILFSVLLSAVLNGQIFNGTAFYYLGGIFMLFCITVITSVLDIEYFVKVYRVLVGICTLVVISQGFFMLSTGVKLAPINILPVPADLSRVWLPLDRPSGFFSEPQMYASFVLPYFAIVLIRERLISLVFIALGVIISGSTYGLAIMLALVLWKYLKFKTLLKTRSLVIISLALATFGLLFSFTDVFLSAYEKVMRTNLMEDIRVGKAIAIYMHMPMMDKIFGLSNSVEGFIVENISSFPWLWPYVAVDSLLLGYISGLFGLAIFFGTGVMLFFIYMMRSYYVKGNEFQKCMVIIILLHSVSATILFNGYYIFFLTLMLSVRQEANNSIKYLKLSVRR